MPVTRADELDAVKSGPETWTPEQRGRALLMIDILANTPPSEWRSKAELYDALAEFRRAQASIIREAGR